MPSLGNQTVLSPEMFASLQICLVLTLFVHLPVLGAVLGGSAVSLLLNFIGRDTRDPRYLRFSGEVIDTVLIDGKVLFLLVLVPVPLMGLILELLFSWNSPLPWPFWILPSGGLLAAFLLLRSYRAALAEKADDPGPRFLLGVAAFLAGTLSFFLFWAGFGTAFNPEKLPLLRERIGFLLSWNSFVKFHLFLVLFLGIAGAVILFFLPRRSGEEEPDPEYRRIVAEWGRGLVTLSALAVPVFLLLGLASLPQLALSASVFGVSALAVLLCLGVVLVLRRSGQPGEGAPGGSVPALFLLILMAVLAGDQAAIGNVFQGRIATPVETAAAEPAPRKGPADAVAAGKGEELFGKLCAGCHRFDQKVVGPPLAQVLPKYGKDPGKLKGFLRNPVKVDPGYPPMPNLGLSEGEIEAIAGYLLEQAGSGR